MTIKTMMMTILMFLPVIESFYKKKTPLAAKVINYFRVALIAIVNEDPIPLPPKEISDAKRQSGTVAFKNSEDSEARAMEKLLEA